MTRKFSSGPRPSFVWWAVLGTSATAIAVANQNVLGWQPPQWNTVNASVRQATILSVPLLAALSAWTAHPTHTPVAPRVAARFETIIGREFLTLASFAAVGTVLGLAPFWWIASRRATFGHVEPLIVCSGFLAMLAAIAVGQVIGILIRGSLAVVAAAAVGCGSAVLLPIASDGFQWRGTAQSLLSIAPRWSIDVPPGWHETPDVTLFRCCLFASITLSAWLLVRLSARPSPSARYPRWRRLFGAWGPSLLLATAGVCQQPNLIAHDPAAHLRCTSSSRVQICLPPSQSALLRPLRAGSDRVFERFGTGAFLGAMTSSPSGRIGTDVLFDPDLTGSEEQMVDDFTRITAAAIVGNGSCFRLDPSHPDDLSPGAQDGAAVQALLSDSILERLGVVAPGPPSMYLARDANVRSAPSTLGLQTRIRRLGNDEISSLLVKHASELRLCHINLTWPELETR